MVIWTSPPVEDIFPIVDKLLADGAGKTELDHALADACDHTDWRDGWLPAAQISGSVRLIESSLHSCPIAGGRLNTAYHSSRLVTDE